MRHWCRAIYSIPVVVCGVVVMCHWCCGIYRVICGIVVIMCQWCRAIYSGICGIVVLGYLRGANYSFFFFFLSLYAFPPKGALGYEAAPFPHL